MKKTVKPDITNFHKATAAEVREQSEATQAKEALIE
jgi:hypothetical protein